MFDKDLWNLKYWVQSRSYMTKLQRDLSLGPWELRLHRAPWKYMHYEVACQGWEEYRESNVEINDCWY